MPYAPEHKLHSNKKILQSAFKLFTKYGFDNITIDQIMHDVGMTRGAFYAHFSSKEELYKKAILSGALDSHLAQKKQDNISDKEWINFLLNNYLSRAHIDGKDKSCPFAFLVTDIAIRKSEIRDTYTKIYKNMNNRIFDYTKSYSSCDKERILAITALIIGGASIARALNDDQLIEELLDACKKITCELLA